MTATVQFTPEIEREIIREATDKAAAQLLAESLLTREEACRFLKVSVPTLNRLPIARVKLGASTRYRRADLQAFVESKLER